MLKHIPNALTIVRFLLIPFILFYIFTGNYILAFIFFTISGITDVVDGFIARKFNLISNFGKLMDPLADKATQIATLASLVIIEIIPIYLWEQTLFPQSQLSPTPHAHTVSVI